MAEKGSTQTEATKFVRHHIKLCSNIIGKINIKTIMNMSIEISMLDTITFYIAFL